MRRRLMDEHVCKDVCLAQRRILQLILAQLASTSGGDHVEMLRQRSTLRTARRIREP
jgi:hypothetical protein